MAETRVRSGAADAKQPARALQTRLTRALLTWESTLGRVIDPLSPDPRARAGRLASLLYALGVTGVVLTGWALPGGTARTPAAVTAVLAAVAGVVFALLPWRRLPGWVALVPPLLGQLLIGGGLGAGAGTPAQYLPFAVLCAVYLGLTGRPGTPLLAAPVALAGGLLTLLHPSPGQVLVPLVGTVVVGTAVGELIAATTRRDARLSQTLDGLLSSLTGLARSTSDAEACALTSRVAAGLLDADAAAVLLPDPRRPGRWQAPGPPGAGGDDTALRTAALLESELGVAALSAALAPGAPGLVLLPAVRGSSLAAVPLRGGDGPVGVLLAVWHRPLPRLDDVARRGVEVLASEAGALLTRLRHERLLHDAATTDPLSGLVNRRVLEAALDRLAPGDAVVLLDLDHFKRLNDVEGHAVGDREIARLGQALRLLVRDGDTAARYGGEEFTLVLPGAGHAGAVALVERLQRQWRSVARTTFSAGVAVHRSGRPPAETLAAADAALYRAKGAGRDTWAAEGEQPVAPLFPDAELPPAARSPVAPARRPSADIDAPRRRVPTTP